jgi:hypothetical protein
LNRADDRRDAASERRLPTAGAAQLPRRYETVVAATAKLVRNGLVPVFFRGLVKTFATDVPHWCEAYGT